MNLSMKLKALSIALPLLWICAPASADSTRAETAKEKANIAAVTTFYNKALNDKDYDAAAVYLGPTYRQHNPTAADGREGFKAFLDYLKAKAPNSHSDIKATFADGDFVILHVLSIREPGTLGTAIVDIFRLDHGKIVEHWDVRQDVPEHPANSNGMF